MNTEKILKYCAVIGIAALFYCLLPDSGKKHIEPQQQNALLGEPDDPFVFKESAWFNGGLSGTNKLGNIIQIEMKLNRDGNVIWRVKPTVELRDL